MRATRYLIIVAAILAVLAAVAWYLRDGLIQRFSNPRLARYGITITDVSLDALAGDGATIGSLELRHESGMTIAIENLRLPIGKPPSGATVYRAGTVTVSRPQQRDQAPADIASLLERLLSLPGDLAGNELRVDEVKAAPYPAVRDLRWTLLDEEQTVRATVDSVAVELSISSTSARHHDVTFASGSIFKATIQRRDSGYEAVGVSSFELPDLAPFAKLVGIVPEEIDFQSGSGRLKVTLDIPPGTSRSASLTARLALLSPIRLTYTHASSQMTSIVLQSGSAVEVAATFPHIHWSMQQAESSVLASYGQWQDVPLEIGALSCETGPTCSMAMRVVYDDAALPAGAVSSAYFEADAQIRVDDDGPRLEIQPGARLRVRDFTTREINVAEIDARLESTGELALTDAGWRLTAGTIAGELDAATIPGDVSIGGNLRFDDIAISELDGVAAARSDVSAVSLTAHWAGHVIDLPGVTGELVRHAERASAGLRTRGLFRDGRIEASHNLDSGFGNLGVDELTWSFLDKKLSDRVSPWLRDWDLAGGNASVRAEARWRPSNGGLAFDGVVSARLDQLAGYYGDTAFAGIATRIDVTRDRTGALSAAPSSIAVRLLDIGVPVDNIEADYALDLENMSIDVDELRMSMLDGTVRADPFSFHTRKDTNTLILRAEDIDLATLLTKTKFETVEVSGRFAAVLPMTIGKDSIIVSGGTLTGEPPGGVIRYLPGIPADEADVSGLGLAVRALSNLEYESLRSAVDYSEDGDLKLELKISGRNPDMDRGRPIVLNLSVENNIPKMLKSLRAARDVEEILEKRIER